MKDILGIFEKFLGQNFKKILLCVHLSEFALTHMSYEKNELKERESVVAAAVLWEMSWKNDQGSVFYHHGCQNSWMEMFLWWNEYGNKNTKSSIWVGNIQSRTVLRNQKDVPKIFNVQCLPTYITTYILT